MANEALKIRGLEKRFARFTLGPLDLTVPRGAIYGLIGPNGAGKTTTIDLVMGMGRKKAGSIEVFGMDHLRCEAEVKQRIGYVSPDLPMTAWGRVRRVVNFFRGFYPTWDDDYCMDLIRRLNVGWDDRIATLSFGTRIKLGVILALSHRPDLLLLDEPILGLDPVSKQEVFAELLSAVRDDNRSVLISSHDLHDIERFTDHIGIIHQGKMLIEGPTSEVVERYCMADGQAEANATFAGIPGVYARNLGEGRWRMLVDRNGDAMEQLKTKGFASLTEAPVTLEELFVAMVKEG